MLFRRSLALLFVVTFAAPAIAQQLCVPGTPYCVQVNGQGGVSVTGSASGQVGGQVGGQGTAQGTAQVGGQGTASVQGGGTSTQQPPPPPPPPPRWRSGGGTDVRPYRPSSGPPLEKGFGMCLFGRAGAWSGYRGGGCIGFALRAPSGLGFDFELVVLGGGTVTSVDVLLRPVLVIPLAGAGPYFDKLGLRIGATMVGMSIATQGGKPYFRFGGSVGLAYEVSLSRSLAFRILEASFYVEGRLGTRKSAYMDNFQYDADLGLMLSTALVFH